MKIAEFSMIHFLQFFGSNLTFKKQKFYVQFGLINCVIDLNSNITAILNAEL
jgi:hypothetical protein